MNYTPRVALRHRAAASELCCITEDDEDKLSSDFSAVRGNLAIHTVQGD